MSVFSLPTISSLSACLAPWRIPPLWSNESPGMVLKCPGHVAFRPFSKSELDLRSKFVAVFPVVSYYILFAVYFLYFSFEFYLIWIIIKRPELSIKFCWCCLEHARAVFLNMISSPAIVGGDRKSDTWLLLWINCTPRSQLARTLVVVVVFCLFKFNIFIHIGEPMGKHPLLLLMLVLCPWNSWSIYL